LPVIATPSTAAEFAAPNLGAYESKEMSSAIERVNHPTHLPDWRDVRADVEIGQ